MLDSLGQENFTEHAGNRILQRIFRSHQLTVIAETLQTRLLRFESEKEHVSVDATELLLALNGSRLLRNSRIFRKISEERVSRNM